MIGVLCPICRAPLGDAGCGHAWPEDDGIPLLLVGGEPDGGVTSRVRAFYEAAPFPDYAPTDTAGTLADRARHNVFLRLLDRDLPLNASVLECGCGTGQLSNFLALASRTVVGADLSLASLRRGLDFARRNGLRTRFLQMDLFHPGFADGAFDLVVANGVLHHTGDPAGGLRSIARLVRPGGHLIVGLYHRYGRVVVDVRGALLRVGGDRLAFLDPRLADRDGARREAWLRDQYHHPHESRHTIAEVHGWLRTAGLDVVRTLPGSRPLTDGDALFEAEAPGGAIERALGEWGMLLSGGREGGLFMVIARRPEAACDV